MPGFAGGNDETGPRSKERAHSPVSTRVSIARKSFLQPRSVTDGNWSSSEEEEDDFLCRVDKRLTPNNVKHQSPTIPQTAPIATALHTERQEELSAAVSAADHVSQGSKRPTGTRLTMASRTSYFTDRIISPTMVSLNRIIIHPHQFVLLDACNGYPVHWSDSQPGFRDRLSNITDTHTQSSSCPISSLADAVRRKGPICGRYRCLRWPRQRGQTSA